jgi:hypothetical protein
MHDEYNAKTEREQSESPRLKVFGLAIKNQGLFPFYFAMPTWK